ncbi:MAG: oligosaccharide flippase family protein [Candidatus Cloacimonetes bacterium]|nr:oligosaccharide flippase family protein [Candidatus Cloacimonadota bacterium]
MITRTVVHGVRWTLLTSIFRRLISLVLLFFVANWLSKEDFGIFRTYCLILGIVAFISGLGFDYHYLTDKKHPRLNLLSLFQISILGSVLLALLTPFFAGLLGKTYQSPTLGIILRYTSVFLITEAFRRCYRVLAQKHLLFREIALAETLNVAVYSLLAIIVIYFYRSVSLYIVLFFVGNIGELLWLLFRTPALPRGMLSRVFSRKWLALSLVNLKANLIFLSNVSSVFIINIFSGNAPILFLGTMVPPRYMGLYFFATQLIGVPVSMLTTSIGQVFFPVFALSDRESTLSGIARYSRFIVRLGIPLLLIYGVLLNQAIPFLFGGIWDEALPLIFYLIIFYGTSLLHMPISGVPYICRKPHWELIWNVLTLGLRLLLLLIGLKSGFNQAVLLFCIGSGIMNLAFYLMSILLLKGRVLSYLANVLLGLLPIALLSLGVWLGSRLALPGGSLLFTLPATLLYVLFLLLRDRQILGEMQALLSFKPKPI